MSNLVRLKNEGIYKEGDVLLYCISYPALWELAVYSDVLLSLFSGMRNFIIVRNDQGIVILPCDKITNAVILKKKIFIPLNEIGYFDIEKGRVGFYKISIMGHDKCLFVFQISKNVTEPIRRNLDLLFNGFECKNIEIIKKPNKVAWGIYFFVFVVVIFMASIFAMINGEYFIALGCMAFFVWLIYALVKMKKNK